MGIGEQPPEDLLKARRSRLWLVGVVLFTLVNFAGGVVAAVQGELLHTGVHAVLLVLGVYATRRLARRVSGLGDSENPELSREITDRLSHLERSVDAVAIEVERIGEGQRFITRVFTQNTSSGTPGEGSAEPIETRGREAPPPRRY
jgi:hypothetical protein